MQRCAHARDIFNILLGAILGGSALTAVGPALADPGHIYITIGEALSKSSNFFINYITVQARFWVALVTKHALNRCVGQSRLPG